MTKSARNGIIAAAVVVVVAVAAAPFAMKALKKQPAEPAEATVSVTEQAEFTYPAAEDTTADIISEILETMDNQTTQAAQAQDATTAAGQPQNTTAAPQQQNTTAAPQQTTTAAPQQQTTTRASIWNRTTTAAPAPAATKAPATTKAPKAPAATKAPKTTKAPATTQAPAKDSGPVSAVNGQEAMSSGGVVSYLWNPEGNFYYVEDNPWQRNFGFNAIYDWAAATMVMYYDTSSRPLITTARTTTI